MTTKMTKTCTHCKETVRAEARKCQFCRFRFDVTPSAWPARAAMLGVAALGGAAAVALTLSVWLAIPELGVALAMFAAATFGARRNTVRQFRDSGSVPALVVTKDRVIVPHVAPRTGYCCPACTPV
jgi:hypothetical protein